MTTTELTVTTATDSAVEDSNRSPEEMRAKILALEASMLAMTEHHVVITPVHYFTKGIYMREIAIPKGTTLTGKIHKTEHMCILSKGEVSVWTGSETKHLHASTVVKSEPGAKRAIFAHEDSVWINVHHNPDDCQDVDLIEERLIAKTFAEIPGFSEHAALEGGK